LNSLLKNLWKTQFQKLNETGYETIIRSADDQRVKKSKLEDDEETTTKQAVWKLAYFKAQTF
jgi:hypothetical protein